MEKVVEAAVSAGMAKRAKCMPDAAIHQDLNVNGDEGDAFVDALCDEFGDWVADWPWQRFMDFNEPPAWLGPKIWKFLRLPNVKAAFPEYTEERLEIGHIVKVIDNGRWFEP